MFSTAPFSFASKPFDESSRFEIEEFLPVRSLINSEMTTSSTSLKVFVMISSSLVYHNRF